jgi:hypothetical protein
MDELEWQRKGATLSDKTARKEFGLTQEVILRGIRSGKLQWREGSMYGNPFLRLLRREVEALVRKSHGGKYLKVRQLTTCVAGIDSEIRKLKARIAKLEKQRLALTAELDC